MTGDRDVRGFDRDCRRAEELLGLLVLDRTTPDETDWAKWHLAGCASCRAAYGYIAVVPQYLGLLTIEGSSACCRRPTARLADGMPIALLEC